MQRPTSATARPPWCTVCAPAGRAASARPRGRGSRPTPGSDRTTSGGSPATPPPAAAGWAAPPSWCPSQWGNRPGPLRTARTNTPAAGCGTATHKTAASDTARLDSGHRNVRLQRSESRLTLGLLQFVTIFSIRLFRSSMLGMLSLWNGNSYWIRHEVQQNTTADNTRFVHVSHSKVQEHFRSIFKVSFQIFPHFGD